MMISIMNSISFLPSSIIVFIVVVLITKEKKRKEKQIRRKEKSEKFFSGVFSTRELNELRQVN